MPLSTLSQNWHQHASVEVPIWLVDRVGQHAAQLLWQRELREPGAIEAFLNPAAYVPTSAFAFGVEMEKAVARIQQAYEKGEKVAIWGDFDADGITATAVLWEGLSQFFPKGDRLVYYIPDRHRESHGLSTAGIDTLRDCQLIVTCDTGSTNLREIEYAQSYGIDVVITDHHSLLPERPPVAAIINPRNLEPTHPLYHLSGVAVAYKLVEALYETLPAAPRKPLEDLLDLVAIGLVADLVQLVGDCRYLAQRGIEVLRQKQRLGVRFLLEQCKKAGDRPTDISFGIAPRINSVSRIWGDVRKCVELLTSDDINACRELAQLAELANTQRKALQRKICDRVRMQLDRIDLSTTAVLVLEDAEWPVGILGLVAGQVTGEYQRPTILCTVEDGVARCSARSPSGIDLYELIKGQEHLLASFGGHPLAAGLSLPAANLDLLREALNQRFWSQYNQVRVASVEIDLTVTIAELGQNLFRQIKLLEPYGMGNPAPKLLIRDCYFEDKFNANIKTPKGQKVEYIKSEFLLVDATGEIRGDWWGHYSYEIPDGTCDVVVELVDNTFKKTYEVRIIDIRTKEQEDGNGKLAATHPFHPATNENTYLRSKVPILDWRGKDIPVPADAVTCDRCPMSWQEISHAIEKAQSQRKALALTYLPPQQIDGWQVWQTLVGLAKYLSRTGKLVTLAQLQQKLGIPEVPVIELGLDALCDCGWEIDRVDSTRLEFRLDASKSLPEILAVPDTLQKFIAATNELAFRQQYFDRKTRELTATNA